MTRRRPLWTAARTRRVVQAVFLLAFFYLILAARYRTDAEPQAWLKGFFLFDPLILVATWLAAHAVPVLLLWSLVVIVLTVLCGRVFCGWVCPLGTIHGAASRVLNHRGKRHDPWSPWQRTKYYLLAGFLVMAVLGVHWVSIFDPLVWLYRTTTVALFPAAQAAVEDSSTAVFRADPTIGPWHLTEVTEPVYELFKSQAFAVERQAFLGTGLIVVLFLGMLALNAYRRRYWCRYLCPLGALLGVFAWRPLLRRATNRETCNQCDLCGTRCPGAAAAAPGEQWKPAECFGCLNCTESCRRESLAFQFVWPWRREPKVEGVDLSKRALVGAALGGLVAVPLLRLGPQARGKTFHPALIRPPGALGEREFLKRCTACGLCMKICPTGGLQPTLTEAGLEGLWTPRLVPLVGHCDYTCNLCGQVCPTGAIQPLSVEEKQKVCIGLAQFDTTRCIPYTYGRDCIICEEQCPIPDKAIYALEVEVRDRNGQTKTIHQPHVDLAKCIGCGVCEHACVFKERPGIRVFSTNESRNTDYQPILPDEEPYG